MTTVKIIPNDKNNPPGKLADAELHFTEGVLEGLKLIGFSIWERRGGTGRHVTFPAREYSVNGDSDAQTAVNCILRDAILTAYEDYHSDIEERERDHHPEDAGYRIA